MGFDVLTVGVVGDSVTGRRVLCWEVVELIGVGDGLELIGAREVVACINGYLLVATGDGLRLKIRINIFYTLQVMYAHCG